MTNENSKVIEITSKEQLTSIINSGDPIIIDFYAEWCGPCKQLASVLDSVSEDKTSVKICKINVDDNSDIANKYAVRSIPTVYYYNNSEQSGSLTRGFLTQSQINSEISTRFGL
jgi:thioredoxin 1